MKLKTLTQLQATVVEADYADAGVRQTVHVALGVNLTGQVSLGPSGLVISRGNLVVAVPMPELLQAAIAAEPLLAAPVKPQPAK